MVRGSDSALIFRNFEHEFPIVTHGEGIYVYDEDGKKYMDGGAGAAGVSTIGHGVEEIVEAMETQAPKDGILTACLFLIWLCMTETIPPRFSAISHKRVMIRRVWESLKK